MEISIFICIFAFRMSKICFLTDSIFSIGGVQRVTAVIAKELAKDDIVTIVTFDKPESYNPELYDLGHSNITYRFFRYPIIKNWKIKLYKLYSGFYLKCHLQSKWTSYLYAKNSFPAPLRSALANELKKGQYDVIIGVHAPLAARLATLRSDLPNTKLIGWIHNSFEALFSDTSLYIGADRKRHYVYQFQKLDEVIVLCKHDAETYQKYDHHFHPKVIYNPLTLIPGELSEGSSHSLLAIGRFSHLHKGFDLLIEAFHLFAGKNPNWTLDIVGEGVEEPMYKELIHNYNLGERVKIHPFTNNIQTYYSKAQIYVLSSRWEGMPLVLVEAMSHGLPIVSSDLPMSKEIMGEFGLYFKNGDVNDLAQALEKATQIHWKEKSKEALEIADRFDIKQIINDWKQVIES